MSKSKQVELLHSLFASGELIHPYLGGECFNSDKESVSAHSSFVDLSAAIALCCGAINAKESGSQLAAEIGGAQQTSMAKLYILGSTLF